MTGECCHSVSLSDQSLLVSVVDIIDIESKESRGDAGVTLMSDVIVIVYRTPSSPVALGPRPTL